MARKLDANGDGTHARPFVPISEHEARVVHLLAEGLDPMHIAEELETTPAAIRASIAALSQRLQTAGQRVGL